MLTERNLPSLYWNFIKSNFYSNSQSSCNESVTYCRRVTCKVHTAAKISTEVSSTTNLITDSASVIGNCCPVIISTAETKHKLNALARKHCNCAVGQTAKLDFKTARLFLTKKTEMCKICVQKGICHLSIFCYRKEIINLQSICCLIVDESSTVSRVVLIITWNQSNENITSIMQSKDF